MEPDDHPWDDFFLAGPPVSEDFLPERASQTNFLARDDEAWERQLLEDALVGLREVEAGQLLSDDELDQALGVPRKSAPDA